MTSGQTAAVRTRDEIAEAIGAFTPAHWARLRLVAKKFAWRCVADADDLLQEAFVRALEGERKCPSDVEVVKFLAEAMRSIADGETEKIKKRGSTVPLLQPGFEQEGAFDPITAEPNAEEAVIGAQNAMAIRGAMLDIFAGDSQARDLLEGIMEDFGTEELRSLTGLDATAYASKRRLIRRTIDKHYPEGWKP